MLISFHVPIFASNKISSHCESLVVSFLIDHLSPSKLSETLHWTLGRAVTSGLLSLNLPAWKLGLKIDLGWEWLGSNTISFHAWGSAPVLWVGLDRGRELCSHEISLFISELEETRRAGSLPLSVRHGKPWLGAEERWIPIFLTAAAHTFMWRGASTKQLDGEVGNGSNARPLKFLISFGIIPLISVSSFLYALSTISKDFTWFYFLISKFSPGLLVSLGHR